MKATVSMTDNIGASHFTIPSKRSVLRRKANIAHSQAKRSQCGSTAVLNTERA